MVVNKISSNVVKNFMKFVADTLSNIASCVRMASVFVCSRFYDFVAVFVNDSQNWDKS